MMTPDRKFLLIAAWGLSQGRCPSARSFSEETGLARTVTDLSLNVTTPDGVKGCIGASALVAGSGEAVEVARGFGNRGAAVSYLNRNRELLASRAQSWLSGEVA